MDAVRILRPEILLLNNQLNSAYLFARTKVKLERVMRGNRRESLSRRIGLNRGGLARNQETSSALLLLVIFNDEEEGCPVDPEASPRFFPARGSDSLPAIASNATREHARIRASRSTAISAYCFALNKSHRAVIRV
jgi:hypothetical protein